MILTTARPSRDDATMPKPLTLTPSQVITLSDQTRRWSKFSTPIAIAGVLELIDAAATAPTPEGTFEMSTEHCARCDGDHVGVLALPLTQPHSPPEAGGLVWTHWFPCPTNGEPVLVIVEKDYAAS